VQGTACGGAEQPAFDAAAAQGRRTWCGHRGPITVRVGFQYRTLALDHVAEDCRASWQKERGSSIGPKFWMQKMTVAR